MIMAVVLLQETYAHCANIYYKYYYQILNLYKYSDSGPPVIDHKGHNLHCCLLGPLHIWLNT